jgi:DNA polymerase-3 subunit delta
MTEPGPPPLVLVTGPEEFLVERAVAAVVAQARVGAPDLEVIRLGADTYESGALQLHASPSLFGGAKAIVVTGLHDAPEELQADLLSLLAVPDPDLLLVVAHGGGPRAKKVLDAMRKAGARVIDCPAVKSERDKNDFVLKEFAASRRRITSEGVRALVEAVGKDLRELAAACSQLVSDTEGTVDDAVVDTYHGGKVEATGFRVADATVAGQQGEALRLLRHAIASGVDPVPIVAVIASQLRQLIKVGSAGRGSSAQLAKSLGMAPWQVDKARRAVGHWSADGLAVAVQAIAAADHEVKGGGRDPVYAVERAILTISRARAAG